MAKKPSARRLDEFDTEVPRRSPSHTTTALCETRLDKQNEIVRDPGRAWRLQRRSNLGHVTNDTVDRRDNSENNGAALECSRAGTASPLRHDRGLPRWWAFRIPSLNQPD